MIRRVQMLEFIGQAIRGQATPRQIAKMAHHGFSEVAAAARRCAQGWDAGDDQTIDESVDVLIRHYRLA